jgi:glutamate:GABA antiporter
VDEPTNQLARAGRDVEQRSAALRPELRLRDLILMQVLFVVSPFWFGVAAKAGTAQLTIWIAAVALFYVPLAIVVMYLARLIPLEGGIYQWSKLAFNEFWGFMVAWNVWLFAVTTFSTWGLSVTSSLAWALGPAAAWIATDKLLTNAANFAIIGALVWFAARGFSFAKWIYNLGAAFGVAVLVMLAALPVLGVMHGEIPRHDPFTIALPAASVLTLNLFGKLSFGALSGLEQVVVFAGECDDPHRSLARSVLLSSPVAPLVYVLCTAAVLAYVSPASVDLIATVPQALALGLRPYAIGPALVTIAVVMTILFGFSITSLYFAETARLPMVAGWDELLPAWFTRIHPRYRTPVNAVLFVGAIVVAIGFAGLAGVQGQEAFQLLWNSGMIFYGLAYLVMFLIPLRGLPGLAARAPLHVRVAAAMGLGVTLMFVALSVLPIIEVPSRLEFSAKIIAAILSANLVGAAIFLAGARRRRLVPATAD